MSMVYILQNQHGYYLRKRAVERSGSGKAGVKPEWVDGQDSSVLFRTPHKDEAINMQFEVNTYNVDLRISMEEYPITLKKHPLIPDEDLPPPLPKISAEGAQQDNELGNNEKNIEDTDNSVPSNITEANTGISTNA